MPSSGTTIAVWLFANRKTSRSVTTDFRVIACRLWPRPSIKTCHSEGREEPMHLSALPKRAGSFFRLLILQPRAVNFREATLGRVAFRFQRLSKFPQEKLHVLFRGQRPHDANTEDFACERSKSACNFDPRPVQQAFSNFRFVNSFRNAHCI